MAAADSNSNTHDADTESEDIDLKALAEKIVELILRELALETERTGR